MSTPLFEEFSISLPPDMARMIQDRVEAGEYASVSEFVREAVRAWMARERRLVALDVALAKGVSELDAGLGEDAQTVREEVQARLRCGSKASL